MTVWIVTQGSYSDYQIRFVTTNQQLAQQLKEADECFDVEEWDLVTDLPDFQQIWTCWERTDRKMAGEYVHTTLTHPLPKIDPEIKDWGYGYSATSTTRAKAREALREHGKTRKAT